MGMFTVGVFTDVAAAGKALDALERQRFEPSMLSLVAVERPELGQITGRLPAPPAVLSLPGLGRTVAAGSLVACLQGDASDLERIGLADAFRRAGYQSHDGQIYETLVGKGGVLLAVESDPRAADALSIFHAYGGGNAAIGAWAGRV